MTDTTLKVIEATTGGTDLGAISFTQGATSVKAGKQHLVDVNGAATGVNGNPIVVGDGGGSLTVDGTVAVTGVQTDALTNTQLRATAVPVSGTVTVNQATAGNLQATVTGTVQANNLVGGTAVSNANPLPISDAGGSLTVDGSVNVGNFPATQAVSGTVTVTQATAGNLNATVTGSVNATLQAGTNSIGNIGTVGTITNPVSVTDNGGSLTVDGTVSVGNFPATQNVAITGTGTASGTPLFEAPVVAGAVVSETNPLPTRNVPANLAVQIQSAAAAAVTLTIPAAGAGLFHYIDVIEIHLYATAARTGAAAPVTVTSTNLPAALSWLFPTAQAIGTIDRYAFSGDRPMKSAVANTATTIVAPAVTGGIVQIKAVYSVGP